MKAFVVAKVIGLLSLLIGLVMLTSIPVALWMGDSVEVMFQLLYSSLVPIVVGGGVFWVTRKKKEPIGYREGFAIVSLGWVFASIFGAIPFVWVHDIPFIDAFFETMSGFTTTGATIISTELVHNGELHGIEALSRGVLYWRAMTHWLGGMGIVVLSLAILPILGVGGMQLFKAEVPGPISDQLTPKIADSAKILWGVYVLLTAVETGLLRIAGMSWFESVCHAFATMATGGFSTRNASVEAFHTPQFANGVYIDLILTVFMFLAGCNFILHLNALRGKPLNYFKDEEFKFYLKIVLFAIFVPALLIYFGHSWSTGPINDGHNVYNNFGEIVQDTSFTAVSILTTTGFCTGDFNLWPTFARVLLLFMMFVGGCGGSTGGGMKVSRVLLVYRYAKMQIARRFFPHMVSNVHMNECRVDNAVLHRVVSFFSIFVGLFVLFSLLFCLCEPQADLETAISSSVACLGNIGPGLGKVGAWENYAWMHPWTKLMLSFAMLAGRLEIFTVLVLFLPRFWKR